MGRKPDEPKPGAAEPDRAAPDTADGQAEEPKGNTLKDASEEAVRALEEGDEPGHAGRGDYG